MNNLELKKKKESLWMTANLYTMLSLGLLGFEPRIWMRDLSNERLWVLNKVPDVRVELCRILLWNLPNKINLTKF